MNTQRNEDIASDPAKPKRVTIWGGKCTNPRTRLKWLETFKIKQEKLKRCHASFSVSD